MMLGFNSGVHDSFTSHVGSSGAREWNQVVKTASTGSDTLMRSSALGSMIREVKAPLQWRPGSGLQLQVSVDNGEPRTALRPFGT